MAGDGDVFASQIETGKDLIVSRLGGHQLLCGGRHNGDRTGCGGE